MALKMTPFTFTMLLNRLKETLRSKTKNVISVAAILDAKSNEARNGG